MPLDVCPGAQHLRDGLRPSERLRGIAEMRAAHPLRVLRIPELTDVERASALEAIAALSTNWRAPIEAEPFPIDAARDIVINAALLLMADVEEERELAEARHVCPGCHAVGEEPCLPGCIDAELAAEDRAVDLGDPDLDEDDEFRP